MRRTGQAFIARVVDADVGADETKYFYDGWQVCEEQDAAKATQATYVYGLYVDEVLNMQRGGNDFYYHADDLYNVMALTDGVRVVVRVRRAGQIASCCVCEGRPAVIGVFVALHDRGGADLAELLSDWGLVALGNCLDSDQDGDVDAADLAELLSAWGDCPAAEHSTVSNPYLFTGRRWDSETGWYYYRTRYLDPRAGRFTTRDTIGIRGDSSNSGNAYAYVGNNPLTKLDPMGRADQGHLLFVQSDLGPMTDIYSSFIALFSSTIDYETYTDANDLLTQATAAGTRIDTIEILSHGGPGTANISDSDFIAWQPNTQSILFGGNTERLFTGLGPLLDEDSVVVLNVCGSGSGARGEGMVTAIGQLTGAIVIAPTACEVTGEIPLTSSSAEVRWYDPVTETTGLGTASELSEIIQEAREDGDNCGLLRSWSTGTLCIDCHAEPPIQPIQPSSEETLLRFFD